MIVDSVGNRFALKEGDQFPECNFHYFVSIITLILQRLEFHKRFLLHVVEAGVVLSGYDKTDQ